MSRLDKIKFRAYNTLTNQIWLLSANLFAVLSFQTKFPMYEKIIGVSAKESALSAAALTDAGQKGGATYVCDAAAHGAEPGDSGSLHGFGKREGEQCMDCVGLDDKLALAALLRGNQGTWSVFSGSAASSGGFIFALLFENAGSGRLKTSVCCGRLHRAGENFGLHVLQFFSGCRSGISASCRAPQSGGASAVFFPICV